MLIGDAPSNLLSSYLYSCPDCTRSPIAVPIANGLLLWNLIALPLSGPPVLVPSPAPAPTPKPPPVPSPAPPPPAVPPVPG